MNTKNSLLGILALALCLVTLPATAQDLEPAADLGPATNLDGDSNLFEIGGHIGLGLAGSAGDADDGTDGFKPRFGGAFAADALFFLAPGLALHAGLGVVGKGYRIKSDAYGTEITYKDIRRYFEIPIGAMMQFGPVRVGADIAILFAMTGKGIAESGDQTFEEDYQSAQWDYVRRFNLAPKISGGYVIPLGPILLIPGLDFSFHILNDLTDDAANNDARARAWNVMFTVGAMFGI